MKVKIEPLRRTNNLIPKCKRCQGFNHTQKYRQKEPRCVKCAGKHLTSNCLSRKDTQARCINCKGAHPASYRGCEVTKELQRIRNKPHKNQVNHNRKVATDTQPKDTNSKLPQDTDSK